LRQRLSQIRIGNVGKPLVERLHLDRGELAGQPRPWPRRERQGPLHKRQSADDGAPKKAVDSLDQQRRAVLRLERGAGSGAEFQGAVTPERCRPCCVRPVRTDNRRPVGFETNQNSAAARGDDGEGHFRNGDAHGPKTRASIGRRYRARQIRIVEPSNRLTHAICPLLAMSALQTPDPATLLAWYDRHRRNLPWRTLAGVRPDPYRVWLSEIMLQQTTVATVGPYFDRFVARWPDVKALAAASLDEVLQLWQGLGYYARARHLHACARAVVDRHDSAFPSKVAGLRALPGIGDYTAAAIAAIAFDRPTAAVDGNVERVVARLYAVEEPFPAAKPALKALAAALVPEQRAGDFAQAMMDLGAAICTPRKPRCVLCPWRVSCVAAACGLAEDLPARTEKPERPLRHGVAFWLTRRGDDVFLRRRPEKGLFGGMIEIPSTPWRTNPWNLAEAVAHAPADVAWSMLPGTVLHGFTHFRLELVIVSGVGAADGLWSRIDRLGEHALPTLMKKIARHAISVLDAEAQSDRATSVPGSCSANSGKTSSPARAKRTGENDRR
jgi:A/G-specific adenine glycosylase